MSDGKRYDSAAMERLRPYLTEKVFRRAYAVLVLGQSQREVGAAEGIAPARVGGYARLVALTLDNMNREGGDWVPPSHWKPRGAQPTPFNADHAQRCVDYLERYGYTVTPPTS